MQFEFDLDVPMLSKKSPLVYPGGKSKVINAFRLYLPDNVTELVSPFMGGGSIELDCAARGIKVTASDNFEPLVNFWKHFIEDANKVIDFALEVFPLNQEQRGYYFNIGLQPGQKNYYGVPYSDFERAGLFLLMNRQSFRGWTLAYGHGKNYSESCANEEVFRKLRAWNNSNISVSHSDYKQTIEKHEGTFMYFDPPYVEKEECYGWQKEDTPVFDHVEFKDRISKLNNKWILSYLQHDLVMDLYKDYEIIEYQYKYTINYKRNHDKSMDNPVEPRTELFILNI